MWMNKFYMGLTRPSTQRPHYEPGLGSKEGWFSLSLGRMYVTVIEPPKQETPSIKHCQSGLTSPCWADNVKDGQIGVLRVCRHGLTCPWPVWNVVKGSVDPSVNTHRTRTNSPFTAVAKCNEGYAEDEEDDEGDDAELWGREPPRHANHPNRSHFPLVLV